MELNIQTIKRTNFKAIKARVIMGGKKTDITFSTNDKGDMTVEIYRGKNYIVNSNDTSWSRSYTNKAILSMPKRYEDYVTELIKLHLGINWNSIPLSNSINVSSK